MCVRTAIGILMVVALFPQMLPAQNTMVFIGPQPEEGSSIRWIETPPRLDCNDKDRGPVTGITLSVGTARLIKLDSNWRPSQSFSSAPPEVKPKVDSYSSVYDLEWDERNLYGDIQVREPVVDNEYPSFSKKAYLKSSSGGFFPDLLYDSLVLVISDAGGKPEHYTTEMHLFVRAPGARQPQWTFFGGTVDEEDFHELSGKAVACPIAGGYSVKFAVAWLPSKYWQAKTGSHVRINFLAPLPSSAKLSMKQRTENAFVLQRSIDITLEK